jgi:hypothetical protein
MVWWLGAVYLMFGGCGGFGGGVLAGFCPSYVASLLWVIYVIILLLLVITLLLLFFSV